ncbi:MAG: 50S ribosomal protein L25, partial [Actinomycetota bacterium]
MKAQVRTATGKGPARQARAAGKVPAVLYGSSLDPVSLSVDAKEMWHALHTEAGANVLINLEVDSSKYLTIPREVHRHPVRRQILHVDFVNVARDVKIDASVPIHLTGESHGAKEGGQVDHQIHELTIQALPTDIPPSIELDITAMGIGDARHVSDLTAPPGVEILNDPDDLIVQVIQEIIAA